VGGRAPGDWSGGAPAGRVVDVADDEGLVPLVAERLAAGHASAPPAVAEALMARHRALAAADAVRERELVALTSAWSGAGVGALLVKGAALAYQVYPRPDLRTRLDTDVLVEEAHRTRAADVLAEAGYELVRQFTGALVTYQAPYVKRRDGVAVHVVDLHWRLANPQPFGDVLSYGEMASASEALSALGPAARGPSLLHALALACVHRIAHHSGADRLIWLYDIHLLAGRASAGLWESLVDLARRRGVSAVCADGLRAAGDAFDTPVPESVIGRLVSESAVGPDRTAAYLRPRRHLARVTQDFWDLKNWRQRARLVREHALPPARYMRDVYAPDSHAPLALLYVRRAWRGARRWLTKP
jgi:hypothetical protein